MDAVYLPEFGAMLRFVVNFRARRYILRVISAVEIRCTIPRRGRMAEATRFVEAHKVWIFRELERRRAAPPSVREWTDGHAFLFQGETVRLEIDEVGGVLRFGGEIVPHRSAASVRGVVERRMRQIAARVLPIRVLALAAEYQIAVHRVTVRAQRSRWGSCSHAGTISLNWRLIQAPDWVRDYVIIHELMHRRQMNHSPRFWAEVEHAFPRRREAEAWLKQNAAILR